MKLDRKRLQKLIKLEIKQIIMDEDALFRDYDLPGDDDKYNDYSLQSMGSDSDCGCGSCPDCDNKHHKSSSYMARPQLAKIAKYASHLLDMIDEDEELEDWQESKIAQISLMMGDVYHSQEYKEEYNDHSHDLEMNDLMGMISIDNI